MNDDANIIIQRTDESSVPVALDQPPAAIETRMLVERPPATEPTPPPFVRPQPPRRPPTAALFQQQRFQQRPKPQPQPQPQRPYVPDTDAFKDFANPNKRMPEEESVGSSALDLPDYGGLDDSSSVGDGSSVVGGGGGGRGYVVDEEEIVRPSLGFASIEDEKQDIILKLHRLKQKGFPVTKNFGMSSDIFEMRTEISKIKYNIELDASIKFSRKMLMGTVSGIEFMNRKWNPFELALDGWSENVMESLDDYDPIFEKLYDKYKGKVSMPPEMELLLAVSGSAFMFHLSHSMLRSLGPSIAEKIKNNPEILKSAVRDAAAEERIKQQQHQQQQSAAAAAAEQRPMRGPTIDPPKPPEIVLNHPESTRTPAKKARVVTPLPSSSSSSDNMSSDNETTEDERISDVVSEDMKSVASVSLSDIKTIDLGATTTTTGRGRGRGRGRAAGAGRGRGRGRAAAATAATEVKSFDI